MFEDGASWQKSRNSVAAQSTCTAAWTVGRLWLLGSTRRLYSMRTTVRAMATPRNAKESLDLVVWFLMGMVAV